MRNFLVLCCAFAVAALPTMQSARADTVCAYGQIQSLSVAGYPDGSRYPQIIVETAAHRVSIVINNNNAVLVAAWQRMESLLQWAMMSGARIEISSVDTQCDGYVEHTKVSVLPRPDN